MRQKIDIERCNSTINSLEKITSSNIASGFNSKTSGRKTNALLDGVSICTKVLDLDFNLQYMSPSGIKSLKIPDISLFYDQPYPFDFYPQSFCECTTKNLITAVKKNKIIEQEASVVDIEGNELWFHSIIAPVESSDGRIESLLVISIDITENNKTELRSSECKKNRGSFPLVEERYINSHDSNFMTKVEACITANMADSSFDVNALAKQLFMSRSTLQRKLTNEAKIGVARYIRQIRLATAHEFIQRGAHRTRAETAYAVGFKPRYFSTLYKKHLSTLSESKSISYENQPIENDTKNIEETYHNILSTGLEALSLTIGVISRIKNDLYEIIAIISDDNVFVVGEVFRLHDTYCREVIEKRETLVLTEFDGFSGLHKHPLYTQIPLEAYISTPIYKNGMAWHGMAWGTLNFSSKHIKHDTFKREDISLVEKLAKQISLTL